MYLVSDEEIYLYVPIQMCIILKKTKEKKRKEENKRKVLSVDHQL